MIFASFTWPTQKVRSLLTFELVAIKASILMIEREDFEQGPFNQFSGIGRQYELFGDHPPEIRRTKRVFADLGKIGLRRELG